MRRLLRCFFVWRVKYPSWEELERAVNFAHSQNQKVIIVTHDVGLCKGNKPGRGNMLMAQALKRVTDKHPLVPVLAQLGVARAA